MNGKYTAIACAMLVSGIIGFIGAYLYGLEALLFTIPVSALLGWLAAQ